MDMTLLRARAHQVLLDATIPELPNHYSGKVRDNYDLPEGRRVLIATDRLSAFDRILCAVPFKGQVLTQTARWWFEQTADLCPNHVLAYPDPNVVVARRLDILPVEVVVRGYLAGTTGTSVLTLYKAGQREMYGIRLPDGMRDNERLPAPIITPTSKEFDGGHDAPLSAEEIVRGGLLTAAQWAQLKEYALALFARGQALAAERGLILADTKYEFGTDAEGRIVLADEIHTPDSSRFWRASSYQARFEAGERPESFDKDFVRNWVASRCDPYRDPIPAIPEEHILATAAVYIEAFETITGQAFHLPEETGPVLDRIRRNLAPLIADATTAGNRGAGDDYPLPGAGQSPANFDAAIAFHRAHETAWPASMYLPNGQYVGTSAIGDRPEFAAVIGPVKPRGGPNGLILQHGQVVAEWGDTARTDMTFSIAKSYLALLAGLAVQDGLIADLDAPVAQDVPGPWFDSPHNARITWRHLLQQTSEWQGTLWGKPDIADHNRVVGSSAGAKAVKGEARTLAEPGSHFEYNDVRVNLLAACLTHRFGRALPDVLRERVMDPIGASSEWEWHGYEGSVLEPEGRALRCVSGGGHWGGGQFIGSRDHARMGQLVLNGGVWEGRRILPEAWLRTMVGPSPCNDQYGMLWWLNGGMQPLFPSAPRDSVFALGAGRSLIWIAPSLSLVTVLRWVDRDSTDGLLGAIMQVVTR